jgi:hypothetical protein
LSRAQVVEQREILVDGLDAQGARVGRRADRDRNPVHLDYAAVQPVHAVQALDERRLAGAVVAQQREHLATAHVEVDVLERRDDAEALAGSAHRQHRLALGGARGGCCDRRAHAFLVA